MFLRKSLTVTVFLLLTSILLATSSANAAKFIYTNQLCLLGLTFESKPQSKTQTINLSADVKITIANILATKSQKGSNIATNTSCQQLFGANYTGDKQEWANFFNSASSGLVNANYQNIQLTLVGETEKVYKPKKATNFLTKEYTFTAAINNNEQLIKNLAILDKANNFLYTFSVSGNIAAKTEINKEFERLLASLEQIKE